MIVSYWLYGSWQLSTDISEFDFDLIHGCFSTLAEVVLLELELSELELKLKLELPELKLKNWNCQNITCKIWDC